MTRDGAGQVPSFSFNPGGLNRSPLPPQGPIDLPVMPMVGGPILGGVPPMLRAPEGAPDRRFFKGPQEELPIEDVGPVSKPNLNAKDPFTKMTKTKGSLVPLFKKHVRSEERLQEALVKSRVKEAMDPITKIVMSDPDALTELRGLDLSGDLAGLSSREKAVRYQAMLRTMKGSDPDFTAKAMMAMKESRAAWTRNIFGKLKGTEEWIIEQNGKLWSGMLSMKEKQALDLAQRSFILAKQAQRGKNDVAAQLATDAAWYARKGDRENFTRAKALLKQSEKHMGGLQTPSKAWDARGVKGVVPGEMSEWVQTFNPRAVERVEAGGGELVPNIGGGVPLNEDADSIARITKVLPPEEVRPGMARTDGYGKPFVEPMPPGMQGPPTARGKRPPPKAHPDWFKVMDANRELENELIRRGMPRSLAGRTGFKGAGAWAAANVPGEEGQTLAHLHGMFQGIRMGIPGAEIVAKDVEGRKATSILELLLDEGVRAPKGAPAVRMKKPTGGLNVNRLVDDMPYLPPIEEFQGRKAVTRAIATAEQEISPMVLEWFASKMPKSLGKLAGAILRGVK